MKLKALQRLHRLRTTLQTHAKHALRMHQTDLAEVEKAQRDKGTQLADNAKTSQLMPGTLLHELEQLSEVLSEQARTLRTRVHEAQAAHDARARDAKQMERLVDQGREEQGARRAQQERDSLEDWLRSRQREER